MVDLLLRRGADKRRRNKNGCTPLMLAAENGELSIMKLLLRDGDDCRDNEVEDEDETDEDKNRAVSEETRSYADDQNIVSVCSAADDIESSYLTKS